MLRRPLSLTDLHYFQTHFLNLSFTSDTERARYLRKIIENKKKTYRVCYSITSYSGANTYEAFLRRTTSFVDNELELCNSSVKRNPEFPEEFLRSPKRPVGI